MSWLDAFFGAEITVQFNGLALPQQPILNLTGSGVASVVNDPTNNRLVATFSGGGGGGGGASSPIKFNVATTTVASSATVPANATASGLKVQVTTPYSAGAQLAIGRTGSSSLLLVGGAIDIVNCPAGTIYDLSSTTLAAWGASALSVIATITGAPSVGSLTIFLNASVAQS